MSWPTAEKGMASNMIRILTAATLIFAQAGCGADAAPADTTEAATTAVVPDANTADLPSRNAKSDPGPPAAAARQVEPAAATLPGVADDALPGKELPAEQFHGRWIVERIAADAAAPPGFTPDRGWIGRTLQFDEDAVGWIGGAESIAGSARCESPTWSIIWTAANARQLAQIFRPAWSALNIPLDRVGPAHHWECDTA